MSHIVEIKTEIRDEQAIRAACVRLQLAAPEHKTCRLFNATVTGLCVQLPGWNYVIRRFKTGHSSALENRPPCGGYWVEESS